MLAGAEFDHFTHALVAGYEGQTWLDRPVTLSCVQVSVAHTRGKYLHQCLVWSRLRQVNVFEVEVFVELFNHGSVELVRVIYGGSHLLFSLKSSRNESLEICGAPCGAARRAKSEVRGMG